MKVYAFKGTPDVVEKSSSGGAFSEIAMSFAQKYSDNYAIYGAAWTKDNEVKHIKVTRLEDIELFNESKYARSNIGGIYNSVAEDLINEQKVLFSGTPCQVSGLIKYLEHVNVQTENLFIIDIICHGSPNPRILKDYVAWLENKYQSEVIKISFRDKSVGWKRYPTKVCFKNGKVLRRSYDAQLYMRMYFSLLILDKGCYSCRFSSMERTGDITLGDFWGIDKIMPEIPMGKGVSLMIATSEKGNEIVETLNKTIQEGELLKEYVGDEFLNYQHNLNRPTEKPDLYEEFWMDYKKHGFEYVVKKYRFDSPKGRAKYFVKSLLVRFDFFDKRLS